MGEVTLDLATGLQKAGGPGALIFLSLLFLKYAFEYIKDKRNGTVASKAQTATDSATALNGANESLRAERAENAVLRKENADLRDDNDELRNELFVTKRDYEAQIQELRRQIGNMTRHLDDLQARLSAGLPPPAP